MMPIPDALFWRKVARTVGCWDWTGSRNYRGYGRTYANGRMIFAHRRVWASIHEDPPRGKIVCHRCDNPACVRPDHLYLGTHRDNMDDMLERARAARNGSALPVGVFKNKRRPNGKPYRAQATHCGRRLSLGAFDDIAAAAAAMEKWRSGLAERRRRQ